MEAKHSPLVVDWGLVVLALVGVLGLVVVFFTCNTDDISRVGSW